MSFERIYAAHSFAELADLSDLIFVGKVSVLSPVQWNQNNGEYWVPESGDAMSATPLRYITIDVVKPIVPDKIAESVKLTSMTDAVLLDEKTMW